MAGNRSAKSDLKDLGDYFIFEDLINVEIKFSKPEMNNEKMDKEKSLNKLIEILKIVDLDFECLNCNKIKTGFLDDLTHRLHRKILNRSEQNKPDTNGKQPIRVALSLVSRSFLAKPGFKQKIRGGPFF